jgi:hypothetical protein
MENEPADYKEVGFRETPGNKVRTGPGLERLLGVPYMQQGEVVLITVRFQRFDD